MGVRVSFCDKFPYLSDAYINADEHTHQVCFMEAFRKSYMGYLRDLYAVPNGGSRNRAEAANMKMEGVSAGVSDLCFSFPNFNFCGLYLEAKTIKGKMSEAQIEFTERKWATGYAALECKGWMQLIEAVHWYMGAMSAGQVLNSSALDIAEQFQRFSKGERFFHWPGGLHQVTPGNYT